MIEKKLYSRLKKIANTIFSTYHRVERISSCRSPYIHSFIQSFIALLWAPIALPLGECCAREKIGRVHYYGKQGVIVLRVFFIYIKESHGFKVFKQKRKTIILKKN